MCSSDLDDCPFVALAAKLADLVKTSGWRPRDLVSELTAAPSAISRLADMTLDGKPDWVELVLLIDQFEGCLRRSPSAIANLSSLC